MSKEKSHHRPEHEQASFKPQYDAHDSDVAHRAALTAEGTVAATDVLAALAGKDRATTHETQARRKNLVEMAVGERTDISRYVEKYIVDKADTLPGLFNKLRLAGMTDKLDSCYRVLIALGIDIRENEYREPVALEIPQAFIEKQRQPKEKEPMQIDKLWNTARIVDHEIRTQAGEVQRVTQLELSVSLKDWRKIDIPPNDPRSNELRNLAKDLESFLETTYMVDTGCADSPMKWYLNLDGDDYTTNTTKHLTTPSERIHARLGQVLQGDVLKKLYSDEGISRSLATGYNNLDKINDTLGLHPPKDGAEEWTVVEGHHGFTGDADLMKKPMERIGLAVQSALSLKDAMSDAPTEDEEQPKDPRLAPILARLDKVIRRKEGREKKRKVWTVAADGMGINGNMAPDEMRRLNPEISDTYKAYGKQIDAMSSILDSDVVAGWSMGGYGVVRALLERLRDAEKSKGEPLTQEDVDGMDLPYVLSITPAFAETCWFSMVTPSQRMEAAAGKGDTAAPPLDDINQYMDSMSAKAKLGFFVSRQMLTVGNIMHLIGGSKRQPLKATFEMFSKLYCGKIFPKDAILTSDEQWIQESAMGHARGFTRDGNGKALKWQRDAINNTVRMTEDDHRLLRLARGNLAEFVGNQDLLVRDKDVWREINDQALGAPAFELPAGHALLGQDCFQEYPFGMAVAFDGKQRRLVSDMLTGDMPHTEAVSWLLKMNKTLTKSPFERMMVKKFTEYAKKYNIRVPRPQE